MGEEGPGSKAKGPPGGGNGVFSQKRTFYSMQTTADTQPELVVTNYSKPSFRKSLQQNFKTFCSSEKQQKVLSLKLNKV